jgi:predicted TIM-barrel fold metal-dependent hydrolase
MDQGSRRAFLHGLTALGCGALLLGNDSIGQTAVRPRRIDVHHHFTPPEYLQFLKAHNQGGGGVPGGRGGLIGAYAGWTLAEDLEDMDRSGTETAILSITTPGFYFGERVEVRKVVRESNEYAAKLRSDHKGRFGSFAALPGTDTDGALREIEYALDTLKADGIGLFSNYGDIWLGDEKLNPLHEELNRRKAVVYVHPIEGNCCRNIVKDVTDTVVEYGADTTRTIASLIFSGTTTRYPEITWIFSHAGGMMPFVIERFVSGSAVEIVPGIQTKGQGTIPPAKVPKGVLYELRRMYYDTAQATNPVAMDALRKVVPVSQIVYGTDYWYRSAQETARGLVSNRVFSEEEFQAINRGNASRILPRYRT